MTDRPIIFSGPMVQALLASRKTQTRRLASSPLRKCQPGDRLYVRENFWHREDAHTNSIGWATDFEWEGGAEFQRVRNYRLRPSIHMPRWASRLTLTVERVEIEPLQSISDQDAIAEGIIEHPTCGWHVPGVEHPIKAFMILSRPTPHEMYVALWDCLHGSGEWLGNPDVLKLKFTVESGNIDRIGAAA